MALLTESGIAAKLDEAIGFDRLVLGYNVQIALRRARNAPRPLPPEPHIDGLPTPLNGVPANVLVSNFTVLVGVFLSPVRSEFAGNFTVWPGSHHRLERHFREHGLETLRNGMPDIPLGPPLQLLAEPGDVVLCHYQLAMGSRKPLAGRSLCHLFSTLVQGHRPEALGTDDRYLTRLAGLNTGCLLI
jgi:hypothetical protein